MQYQQQNSQSRGKSVNQAKTMIDDSFLKFLGESSYLESESSQENHQKLINCQTEHTLSTKESCNSNSFTLTNKKFKFSTYEILEWETLQITLPPEVYNFLTLLKCECYKGIVGQSYIFIYNNLYN